MRLLSILYYILFCIRIYKCVKKIFDSYSTQLVICNEQKCRSLQILHALPCYQWREFWSGASWGPRRSSTRRACGARRARGAPPLRGPAHAVPGACGVRDSSVRPQLPGRVALCGADSVRGVLHADGGGDAVSARALPLPGRRLSEQPALVVAVGCWDALPAGMYAAALFISFGYFIIGLAGTLSKNTTSPTSRPIYLPELGNARN